MLNRNKNNVVKTIKNTTKNNLNIKNINNTNSNSLLIQNKLENLEKIKDSNKYWNITWEQGEFISNLVLQNNFNNILEIGTSNGFSTLWLAKNLNENSKIYTIEVNEIRFNEAKKNFKECNLNNINQILGEVFEIFNSKKLENIEFDFVFIDAAHKFYEKIILELIKNNNIANNSIVLCDNIISHEYMNSFIDFMKTKFKHNEIIELGGGFLLSKNLIKQIN